MDAQLPTSPDPWIELRARRRRRRPWAAALIVAAIGLIPAVLWFALEGLPLQ